ncbi:hypothetical protein QA612_03425 [Evansella sp. AB-P1]|uniref:hypothetical protein n=1 Tax=Evansella sp. AB-P1 TaxID=3037653 RepID=UPI00241FA92A|nr:hypothetical protein [Evansella sp. AB-P1]MDG5786528.1 hypothetical protein [Evansella sp. AB-P1]
MGHILSRGFILAFILMFGFILGIIYSNHFSLNDESSNRVLQRTEDELDSKQENIDQSSPYSGLIKQEENIIEMEDGEGLVIYNHGDEKIREELIEEPDLKRDLLDKQMYSAEDGQNLFSQTGIRTADAFESLFKGFFSIFALN